jgi:hypothetical protein
MWLTQYAMKRSNEKTAIAAAGAKGKKGADGTVDGDVPSAGFVSTYFGSKILEKQYGPWDLAAATMVLNYHILQVKPWTLLLSFNGWVKYACLVGGVSIVVYDPQPLLWGAVTGSLLYKINPALRAVKV